MLSVVVVNRSGEAHRWKMTKKTTTKMKERWELTRRVSWISETVLKPTKFHSQHDLGLMFHFFISMNEQKVGNFKLMNLCIEAKKM